MKKILIKNAIIRPPMMQSGIIEILLIPMITPATPPITKFAITQTVHIFSNIFANHFNIFFPPIPNKTTEIFH